MAISITVDSEVNGEQNSSEGSDRFRWSGAQSDEKPRLSHVRRPPILFSGRKKLWKLGPAQGDAPRFPASPHHPFCSQREKSSGRLTGGVQEGRGGCPPVYHPFCSQTEKSSGNLAARCHSALAVTSGEPHYPF
jgi:hypothetical protein